MSTMMLPTEVLRAYREKRQKKSPGRVARFIEAAAGIAGQIPKALNENPIAGPIGRMVDYSGMNPLYNAAGGRSVIDDVADRAVKDPFGLASVEQFVTGDAPPEQHTTTTAPPKVAMAKAASTAHTPTAIAAKNGVKSSLFASEESGVEPVETPKIPDMGGAGVLMAPDDPRRGAAPVPQELGSPLQITRDPDGTVRWTGGGSQRPGSFKRAGDPRVIRDAFGGTAVEGNAPGFAMANEPDTRRLGELARAAQTQEARNALGIQQAQAQDIQTYGYIPDDKTRALHETWLRTEQEDADYRAQLEEIARMKGTAPQYDDAWYEKVYNQIQRDRFLKNKAPGGAYMSLKPALNGLPQAIAGGNDAPG